MDIAEILREGMQKSKQQNNNTFVSLRGTVDRLTSHTIVEMEQDRRKLNLNLLFFLQVYDEYLDEELSRKTKDEIDRQIKNNPVDEDTPDSIYRTIVEIVEPIEYRDLISDNDRDHIN